MQSPHIRTPGSSEPTPGEALVQIASTLIILGLITLFFWAKRVDGSPCEVQPSMRPNCNDDWPGVIGTPNGPMLRMYCRADFDRNGEVGYSDLSLLLEEWGPYDYSDCAVTDLNGNREADFSDLIELLASWGECPYWWGCEGDKL